MYTKYSPAKNVNKKFKTAAAQTVQCAKAHERLLALYLGQKLFCYALVLGEQMRNWNRRKL